MLAETVLAKLTVFSWWCNPCTCTHTHTHIPAQPAHLHALAVTRELFTEIDTATDHVQYVRVRQQTRATHARISANMVSANMVPVALSVTNEIGAPDPN